MIVTSLSVLSIITLETLALAKRTKIYFLILSSSSGDVLWTQEIYHRCNFSPVGKFIQFSGDDCQIGLNFENEVDDYGILKWIVEHLQNMMNFLDLTIDIDDCGVAIFMKN